MSSLNFRTFRRRSIAHVPFLAAHHRVSDSALHAKLPNGHRYPALVLAVAAAAVAVAPLTASAATTTTPAKPAAAVVAAAKTAASTKAAVKTPAKAATAKTQSTTTSTTAVAKKAETASPAKSTTKSTSATTTPAVRSSNPYAGVSWGSLEPTGTSGYQETFSADSSQWSNARSIVQAASDLGDSPYAATIAVATALQESTLHNLTYGDRDSVGLFQQRPSMGWGSVSELTDPTYAAKAFLKQLPSGYENMSLSSAAQSVQRSFDGSLYSKWETQAANMVHSIANG